MSQSTQSQPATSEVPYLIGGGIIIGGGLALLGSFTLLAYTHHDIASLSPTRALTLIRTLPHPELFSLLKESLLMTAVVVAILSVLVLVGYTIYKDRHAKSDHVEQVIRKQWARYDDVRKFAGTAQLYGMAHLIRRDIVPNELPKLPTHGRDANPTSIAGYPCTMFGTFIGHYVDDDDTPQKDSPVWLDYEKSILILGPARSGKNYYFLNSMIAEHVGPLLTTCVRADLVVATLGHRATQGPVFILDPDNIVPAEYFHLDTDPQFHKVQKVGWNILDGCKDANMVEARVSQLLAGAKSNQGGDKGVSDFYTNQIAPIIKAAMFYASLLDLGFSGFVNILNNWDPNPATIGFLNHLIAMLDPALRREIPVIKDLNYDGETDTRLSDLDQRSIVIWLNVLIPTFTNSGEQTFKTFFSGFMNQTLRAFRTPSLVPLFDPTYGIQPFDVEDFIQQNGTLYIVGNIESQKLVAPIIVGLISDLYQRAQVYASRVDPSNPRLQPPLGMYLDEVASLAPLPDDLVKGILTTGAGSGIRFAMVLQDKRYAEEAWGKEIGSAIDANVGAVLFLPGNANVDVARTYSELIGSAYVTWSADADDPNNPKQSGFQQILRTEDINRLKPGRAILVMRSQLPLEVAGIPYPERAWYKQMRASVDDLLARPIPTNATSIP